MVYFLFWFLLPILSLRLIYKQPKTWNDWFQWDQVDEMCATELPFIFSLSVFVNSLNKYLWLCAQVHNSTGSGAATLGSEHCLP